MFIKLRKLLIVVVHTDDTDGHGCPQADGVGERESSEIKRKLNGGPQADEGRIQVSINDDWLLIIDDWWLIIDCLHTDDTDGHGGPQADGVGERESSEFKRI